jgi:hypothetical protein
MRRSEIFESFVKIAQEKGLISEAEHAEHTEKSFSETNPRHDSLTIEQIGKLYGVKPDMPKDMEYKRNIIEDAHPDPVVLSPSYDKLNGLVENENEGQNIRIHITLKEPDGHLTQRKYARKQLLLSLVRIGNELDNRGDEELRKLADACLEQAASDTGKKKVLTKQGWVWIAAGIAAAVGLLYLQQHKNFHSDGFSQDYNKVIGELDDLLTSNVTWYGTGKSFKPEFLQEMNKFKQDLGIVNAAVQKVMPYIQSVEKPRTKTELTQELARIAKDPKTQEATQAVEEFKRTITEYTPEIFQIVNNFNRQSYKNEVIVDKGVLEKAVDWAEVLHGGGGLVSDDFDDVRRALLTLWGDIKDIYSALKQATSIQQSLQKELEQSEAQLEKMDKPETPAAKPEEKPGEKPEDKSPWGALEEEGQGILSGGLGGLFGK